jgi:thiol-disulfide isomerase/thioredoxin
MKHINFILYTLLFPLILLVNCSRKSDNQNLFESPKKIIITGEIINYNPDVDDYFIKFGVDDLFDIQKTTDIEISENGFFTTTFESFYPSEYFFHYHKLVPFYAFPGDSIHFTFNNDSIKATTSGYNHLKHIQFSGKFNQMTNDYFEYFQFYYNELYDWDNEHYLPQQLDSSEYLKHVTGTRWDYYQNKLEAFLQRKSRSAFFKNWIEYDLKYEAYEDLIHYKTNRIRLLQKKGSYTYKDNFLPPDYNYILQQNNFNNPNAVCSGKYRSFIRSCRMYISSHNLPIDSLEVLFQHYRNNERITAFKIQQKMIEKSSSGFGKDLLLANLYFQLLEWNDLESFSYFRDDLKITNPYIKDYLILQYDRLIEFSTSKTPTEVNTHSKSTLNTQIFDSIIGLYPDKVLFIDFWAPWCGPCMGGIEDSKKLKREFKGKDIVFIYLGYNCTENSWKTTINEKEIKGEHFHLTKNQCSLLSNRFKITGIPRYIIVNKKGEIINSDAPSPFEYETLKKGFEKLLGE